MYRQMLLPWLMLLPLFVAEIQTTEVDVVTSNVLIRLMLLPVIANVGDLKPHYFNVSDLRKPCLITGKSLSLLIKIDLVHEKTPYYII